MTKILVLDTGPAGKIAHPSISPDIRQWLQGRAAAGDRFVLPEIVDYELRRNFLLEIRRGRTSFARSLQRLDQLRSRMIFLPLNSEAMLKAAELWANLEAWANPQQTRKSLTAMSSLRLKLCKSVALSSLKTRAIWLSLYA